jgi:hypothetical protein
MNVVIEMKNELTRLFTNVLAHQIYTGIYSIYHNSKITCEKVKDKANQENIITLFKLCLKDVALLNKTAIETEIKRIKDEEKCGEWIEDLFKAILKIYLVFYTNGKQCPSVDIQTCINQSFETFVHKCYIDVSTLFIQQVNLVDERKKHYCIETIRTIIVQTLQKSLPLKQLLHEIIKQDLTIDISKMTCTNIPKSEPKLEPKLESRLEPKYDNVYYEQTEQSDSIPNRIHKLNKMLHTNTSHSHHKPSRHTAVQQVQHTEPTVINPNLLHTNTTHIVPQNTPNARNVEKEYMQTIPMDLFEQLTETFNKALFQTNNIDDSDENKIQNINDE